MTVQCAWCEEEKAVETTNTAYWNCQTEREVLKSPICHVSAVQVAGCHIKKKRS